MEMYCAPKYNLLYSDNYYPPTSCSALSPFSQSYTPSSHSASSFLSYSSSLSSMPYTQSSNYSHSSQSSFSPLSPLSPPLPYTPLSSSSFKSYGNENVFQFPSSQCQYFLTREDLICDAIVRAKTVLEIEKLGQSLISLDKRHVIQNNGQKTLMPTVKKEPKRGSELYVALPKAGFDGFLYSVFSQFGTIHQIRIMMNYNGSNKGYGYVMMSTPMEAEKALVNLAEHTFPGIRGHLSVSMSTDNRTLFARNIPNDLTDEQLLTEFQRRVEGVKKVRVFNDTDDPSKNREFCFVVFKDHKSANLARRSMAENPFFINGMAIKIKWADSEPVFRHSVLMRMKQLHIKNINPQTTEDDILNILGQYVVRNKIVYATKKNNTCAKIKFRDHEYADIIQKNIDGKRVHGTNWVVMWDKSEGAKYENERCFK